jgi:hypothetical protein
MILLDQGMKNSTGNITISDSAIERNPVALISIHQLDILVLKNNFIIRNG